MQRMILRWLDEDPGGLHRPRLFDLLRRHGVALRFGPSEPVHEHALVLVGPRASARWRAVEEAFKGQRRPVAKVVPMPARGPADLLIALLDGLVAQLDETEDSSPFDDVLIDLLRFEWVNAPQRYPHWLIRALVNAALARADRGEDGLSLLEEAAKLGPPPQELDREDRTTLLDAIAPFSNPSGEQSRQLRAAQDWLLLS